MKVLTQHVTIHPWQEEVIEYDLIHIYSETGHFREGGWHIVGVGLNPQDYHEIDDGVTHEIPESLPDIEEWEPEPEPEPEEGTDDGTNEGTDASIEDYQAALEAVGVSL